MPVRDFDRHYAEELVERLRALRSDTQPLWGSMTAAQLIPRLTQILRYSMARTEPLPFAGNWMTRRIMGPLVLRGLFPILKNLDLPQPNADTPGEGAVPLETFHAVLEDYLGLVETGGLSPPHHPLFGDIGVDGWARMHVVHFEHHLKQFGL